MIDIIPIMLVLVAVWKISIVNPISSIDREYSSISSGRMLRGLFAIVIVIGHIRQHTGTGLLMRAFDMTGHLAASGFFFLSGYGLLKSLSREKYLKNFPKKRLFSLVIPYLMTCVIYWVAYRYVNGYFYSFSYVINSFVKGEPLVDHSWYIIESVVLYFSFYIFAVVFKKNKNIILLASAVICIVVLLVVEVLDFGRWWSNSTFGFVMGMIWEINEERINSLAESIRKYILVLVVFVFVWCISFVLAMKMYGSGSDHVYHIIRFNAAIFPCLMFLVTMKLKLGSPMLDKIGEISLEFYLIHGLIINVLRSNLIYINSDLIFAIGVITVSAVVAWTLNLLFRRISSLA